MSWARHNPEKYDEIIAQGVANRFGVDVETATEWLERDDVAREFLLQNSNQAICDAEADYFGDLVDAAREREQP